MSNQQDIQNHLKQSINLETTSLMTLRKKKMTQKLPLPPRNHFQRKRVREIERDTDRERQREEERDTDREREYSAQWCSPLGLVAVVCSSPPPSASSRSHHLAGPCG